MDSLIVIFLFIISPINECKYNNYFKEKTIINSNKYKNEELFNNSDNVFNRANKIDYCKLKEASNDAAKSALNKTIDELYKALGCNRKDD